MSDGDGGGDGLYEFIRDEWDGMNGMDGGV